MQSRKIRGAWIGSLLAIAVVALISATLGAHGGRAATGHVQSVAQCTGGFSNGSAINVVSPKFLPDVPKNQLFCDFHTFGWNQFIYLTQMQSDPNNGGRVTPLFMHLAPWYNMLPRLPGAQPGAFPGGSTALLAGPIDKLQAGDQDQLLDVNSAAVLYDIRFNDTFYNSVVSQKLYNAALFDQSCAQNKAGVCANPMYLPAVAAGTSGQPASAGSLEVKTAWRDFGAPAACPGNFYCNGRFGLVGMHIVQKTPTHGEWIWASFEHEANAPDCNLGGDSPIPQTAPSGKPWSFFNPASAPTDVWASQACKVTAPAQCNSDPRYQVTKHITLYRPVNVCRTDTVPAGGASAANCAVVGDGPPQQSSNSPGNVACLNASLRPQLPGVWTHYKMIGSLWVRGQTGPTQDFRIQAFQTPPTSGPPTPYAEAVGFPHLANTTMETWLQAGSTGYDPFASSSNYGTNATQAGCFLCHNLPTTGAGQERTADLSHFPARLAAGVQQARRAALVAADSTTAVRPEQLQLPESVRRGRVLGAQPGLATP